MHAQLLVEDPLDVAHGVEQLAHAAVAEHLARHRDDQAVRGGEGVEGEHPEARGAVEQDDVVVALDVVEGALQHVLAGRSARAAPPRRRRGRWCSARGRCPPRTARRRRRARCRRPARRAPRPRRRRGRRPRLKVRHAWGSRSTSSTRRPCSAKAAPSEATEVVLATPPFWFARAMIVALRLGAMGGLPWGPRDWPPILSPDARRVPVAGPRRTNRRNDSAEGSNGRAGRPTRPRPRAGRRGR